MSKTEFADSESARKILGVPTQAQFAPLLGVSPQQYRKIIASDGSASKSRMSPASARLIQAYLDGYRPGDWPAGS